MDYNMKFLDDITDKMECAIILSKSAGKRSAYISYPIYEGYIDIWCNDKDETEVVVYQHGKDKEYPLLQKAITNAIPLWDSVEIEPDEDPYSDWVRYYGRI